MTTQPATKLTVGRGFLNPVGLAVSSDGRVFVLNRDARRPRVCVCNIDEEFLHYFSDGPGSEDGQLHLPTCMAFDSKDRLYITDEANHRVSIFDTGGNCLGKWGEQGDGDGQFIAPHGVAV